MREPTIYDIPSEVLGLLLRQLPRFQALNFKATCRGFYSALATIKPPLHYKIAAQKRECLIINEHQLFKLQQSSKRPQRSELNQELIPCAIGLAKDFHLILYSNGTLQGSGKGFENDGRKVTKSLTILLPVEIKGKRMSVGYDHALVLGEDDQVYSFGDNHYGQLGLGDRAKRFIPTCVKLPPDVIPTNIFACRSRGFIVDANNNIYGFGMESDGCLGVLDPEVTKEVTKPRQIKELPTDLKPIQVDSGDSHTLVLYDNGSLYSLGSNRFGQTGQDNNIDYFHSPKLVEFLQDKKVRKIAAALNYSVAVTEKRELYVFGKIDGKIYEKPEKFALDLSEDVEIVDAVANCGSILLLCSNEDIWVLGENIFNNLLQSDSLIPTLLPKLTAENTVLLKTTNLPQQKKGQKRKLDTYEVDIDTDEDQPKPKQQKTLSAASQGLHSPINRTQMSNPSSTFFNSGSIPIGVTPPPFNPLIPGPPLTALLPPPNFNQHLPVPIGFNPGFFPTHGQPTNSPNPQNNMSVVNPQPTSWGNEY